MICTVMGWNFDEFFGGVGDYEDDLPEGVHFDYEISDHM